jgi:Leucine-rich repeat (LRR) protein
VIPPELGNCEVLEELILSENMIEELPVTLAKIQNLRVLKMTNNKLKSIPFEIADILTLEDFDCGNNPHLESIPPKWRDDTESVLFTLRVHRDYNVQMNEMVQTNRDLARHSQNVEQDNLLLKEKVLQLQAHIEELNKNMPKKIAKRMEEDAKRKREAELSLENEDEKKQNQCLVS